MDATAPPRTAPATIPGAPIHPFRRALPLIILLLAAAAVAFSGTPTARPLDSHEVYVAQTAREMIQRGDYITPYYNGEPRLQKPPLMYWLVACVHHLRHSGYTIEPFEARLPSRLAGIVLILMTWLIGARLFDRTTGWIAGALAAGTFGFYEYTHSARPEMLYAACSVTGLALFVCALTTSIDNKRAHWLHALLAWAAMGLALLAKGPQIPLLIVAGLILHAAVARDRSIIRRMHLVAGFALMLAIAAPWYIALAAHHPGAVEFWMSQLFAGREFEETKGIWNILSPYYLYSFPGILLPWAILLPFGIAVSWMRGRQDLRPGRMLFWVVITTILIMGLSTHRRGYYLLALIPPMCVLMSRGTIDFVLAHWSIAWRRRATVVFVCLGALAVCGAVAATAVQDLREHDGIGPEAASLAALIVILITIAALQWKTRLPQMLIGSLACAVLLGVATIGHEDFLWSRERFDDGSFAAEVARRIAPTDDLTLYRIEPAPIMQAMQRNVEVLRDPEALAAETDDLEWIVTRAPFADQLLRDRLVHGTIELRQDDSGDDPLALVRVIHQ